MTPRYVIKPRPDGDGFDLTGPRLPYALWNTTEDNAISYATHLMRDTGGKIHILDRKGHCIITETADKTLGEDRFVPSRPLHLHAS